MTLFLLTVICEAQTPISKSVNVLPGQRIEMHFDYPNLIQVSTWDKNEIQVNGMVMINAGENDDRFELTLTSEGGVVSISSRIRDIKSLPQRIFVIQDGRKIMFKSKAEFRRHKEVNDNNFGMINCGQDMEIQLEIKVPQQHETFINSVYGMVEVKDFKGPLKIEATYGGVDAALAEKGVGELMAETNYGQIYSNLNVRLSGEDVTERDFHTLVSAKPGSGPRYTFESKYGNVYLRKAGDD